MKIIIVHTTQTSMLCHTVGVLTIMLMVCLVTPVSKLMLLNQACTGHGLAHAWYLEIDLVRDVRVCLCVCICVYVHPLPRLVITSGVMWHDMDPT